MILCMVPSNHLRFEPIICHNLHHTHPISPRCLQVSGKPKVSGNPKDNCDSIVTDRERSLPTEATRTAAKGSPKPNDVLVTPLGPEISSRMKTHNALAKPPLFRSKQYY